MGGGDNLGGGDNRFAQSVCLYHALRAQPCDFGVAFAQESAQHFLGMLTEQRRREPVVDLSLGKAHRAGD